jgi:hypothetical protein
MKRKLITLFTAAAALAAAGIAVADEIENLPPSMCVASSGDLTYRSDGQVENASAASVTAICPAPRPSINGSFTTDFSGNVWVIDRHPTLNVCCRAYSKNPGGAVVTGTQVCSTGESSTYQTLTLPGINDPYSWSHFYVQCTIPAAFNAARSRILTYRSTQL